MVSTNATGDAETSLISPAICQAAQNSTNPELSKGTWNKPYGRFDFDRFDQVNFQSASVGGAAIGHVNIDCSLLFAESKWGTLEDVDAGIVYMDFQIEQPAEYSLAWATIEVTLENDNPGSTLPVQITPYYGPRRVQGPESTKKKMEYSHFEPRLEFMGTGGGLGGKGFEAEYEVPYRWEFMGSRVSQNSKNKNKKVYTGEYRTLEWKLKENELDPGRRNLVKTAFAFARPDGAAFLMRIKVRGGLEKTWDRFKTKLFKFLPDNSRKNETSTTRIGTYHGPPRSLDRLAGDLDRVMEFRNQQLTALELPRPQPATFLQVPNHCDAEESQSSSTLVPSPALVQSPLPQPTLLLASDPPDIQGVQPIALPPASQDPTEPTLENLHRMALSFMRPGLEAIREDVSSLSPVGSSTTTPQLSQEAEIAAEVPPVVSAAQNTQANPPSATEVVTKDLSQPKGASEAELELKAPIDEEVARLHMALLQRTLRLRAIVLGIIFKPLKIPVLILQRLRGLIRWPRVIYCLFLRLLLRI